MKIYIKSSRNESVEDYNDDELNEIYLNIIDEREGVDDDNPRADYLDEMYWDVTNEIGRRKANGTYRY